MENFENSNEKPIFENMKEVTDFVLSYLRDIALLDIDSLTTTKSTNSITLSSEELTPDIYIGVVNTVKLHYEDIPISYNSGDKQIVIGLNGPMSYFPPIPTAH